MGQEREFIKKVSVIIINLIQKINNFRILKRKKAFMYRILCVEPYILMKI